MRGKPLLRQPPKADRASRPSRKTHSGFPDHVVLLAWTRAQHRCERCGVPLIFDTRGWLWSAQHRIARGMGGSREPHISSVVNCAVLCGSATTPGSCHNDVENVNRQQAYDDGWALRSWQQPHQTPINHWQLGPVLLTDHGYEPIERSA